MVQEIFRRNGQIRNFVLFTFCAGLAILLKKSRPKTKVIIDQEYSGKNSVIKNILGQMLKNSLVLANTGFGRIGKQSPAHLLAGEIARGKKKPALVVGIKEVLREIKMTEVGKRLKNA